MLTYTSPVFVAPLIGALEFHRDLWRPKLESLGYGVTLFA